MGNNEPKDVSTPEEEEAAKVSSAETGEKKAAEALQRGDEPESFQALYQESLQTLEEGQILKGTVIDITPDHVTVDVGYKSEGQIPIREFLRRDKKVDVKIGDRIEVLLEKKISGQTRCLLCQHFRRSEGRV